MLKMDRTEPEFTHKARIGFAQLPPVLVTHCRAVFARWLNLKGEVDANEVKTRMEHQPEMLASVVLGC